MVSEPKIPLFVLLPEAFGDPLANQVHRKGHDEEQQSHTKQRIELGGATGNVATERVGDKTGHGLHAVLQVENAVAGTRLTGWTLASRHGNNHRLSNSSGNRQDERRDNA